MIVRHIPTYKGHTRTGQIAAVQFAEVQADCERRTFIVTAPGWGEVNGSLSWLSVGTSFPRLHFNTPNFSFQKKIDAALAIVNAASKVSSSAWIEVFMEGDEVTA